MRFLPQLDPQSLELSVLMLLLDSESFDLSVLANLENNLLFEDGMEVLGRPVL